MARRWRWLAVVGFLALPVPARAQGGRTPADTSRTAWTVVTYVTGTSVYIDGGSKAGLTVGARVDVVRRGTVIAELAVEFISSTRASSRLVRSTELPVVGDSARFTPAVAPKAPVVAAGGAGAITPSRSRSTGALRGRFGLRHFSTSFSSSPGGSISQPALDARLDGQMLGGTPLGLTVDVRAHRTRRAGDPSSGSTRVYQAAVHLDGAAGPGRITMGRQFATALSPVGLFDGVSADYTWKHTGAGLFAGAQPDATDFGLSGDIREYGAWFRLHSTPAARGSWSLTTGAIGSYAKGDVNREFAYLQGQYVNRAFSLFAAQEVDYNRGWRAEVESTTTTPTSTFVTARLALGPAVSVNAGYDNRRSVRLYRDFISPELEFDDSFRQGAWAGTQVSLGGHFQAGFDARSSRGGPGGSSESWTASTGLTRLTPLGLGVRARATRYAGTMLEGELQSASVEMQPGGRFRLEMSAGSRKDIRPQDGMAPAALRWLGADFDTGIGRSLFFTLSTYREMGPEGRMVQYFGSLSWRF